MSYGMMIAVQLDKKAEFDALWNWAKSFMYQAATNHPACGFFSWSMQTNGVVNDEMPAPDGEEYFVTALFFASARWGDGAGIYNYKSEAARLLSDLKNRATITGQTRQGIKTCVALFDPVRKMVRFTPDAANSEHTDPSYQLPAFYELWSRCGVAIGSRILERSRFGKPRIFPACRWRFHRTLPGIRELRRHAVGRTVETRLGGFPLRCLAHGYELVGGLVMVAKGRAGKNLERPAAGVFCVEKFPALRKSIRAVRRAAFRRPLDRSRRDECRGRARGDGQPREKIYRGTLGCTGAVRTVSLL